MTELWLIRHGQTEWNKAGRYQGQADIPLNETGFAQARQVGEMLAQKGVSFAALYSSNLLRARQTAEVIANRLAVPLSLEPGLREISQGEWEGRSYQEVIGHYKRMAAIPDTDPAAARAPGGESVAEVALRVSKAVEMIARRHPGERVLLVMHALVLAALFCADQDISLREVYDYLPDHAAIQILRRAE